ncbi:MAG: hypothetical protein LLF76_07130 [Planctomycetaceae bacterium]|nr:hypothetical protein [Planctomycetaceae bacterium]
MGHWRSKILLGLILYFGGFFTAVYVLAPATAQARTDTTAQRTAFANVDTQALAGKLRGGLTQAVHFAEEQSLRAAEAIRSKMSQSKKSEQQ